MGVGQEHLVEFGEREATELLSCGHKRNVADHLQGRKHRLRFRVLNVGHFKTTLKDRLNIKQTAIHATQNHVTKVMDINIAALNEFFFLGGQIKLFIKALSEIAFDQRPLRGNQRAVKIGVFTVTQAQNVVRILTQLFKGLGVVGLVVAVFGVRLGDVFKTGHRQHGDDKLVKLSDGHLIAVFNTAEDGFNDFVTRRLINGFIATHGGLIDRDRDLLWVEVFK